MLRVGAYLFPYHSKVFFKALRTFGSVLPLSSLFYRYVFLLIFNELRIIVQHSKVLIDSHVFLLIPHFKIAVNRLLSDDDTRIKVSALCSVAILPVMVQVGIDTEIVKSQPVFAQVYDFKLVGIEMFKEGYGDSHIPIIIIRNVTYPVHIDSIEIVKMPMVAWNVGNMKMQKRSNLFRVR